MDSVGTLPPDALSRAVIEIEKHVSSAGWDQPAQLFALVPTEELLRAEPQLAAELGTEDASQPLTPVAQGELPGVLEDEHLADALARIEWPDGVTGCALAIERIVLPASAEAGLSSVESDAELALQSGGPTCLQPALHRIADMGGHVAKIGSAVRVARWPPARHDVVGRARTPEPNDSIRRGPMAGVRAGQMFTGISA